VALEVSLLGPPRVRRDGEPVAFDTRKATALLAHLALADRPRSRESLCELLWPGRDPEHARGALRRTLSTLRKSVGDEWIVTEGDSVLLPHEDGLALDVSAFRARAGRDASPEALGEAVALFRGGLLEGFSLRDSPEFDHWQAEEAQLLRRELGSALARLVEALAARGEHVEALAHARRRLALDPLHEPAHRDVIRLYAWAGDRGAALAQYRDCVRTLSHELGVAPVEETAALFDRVSDGTLDPPAPRRAAEDKAAAGRQAPAQLPLVGREDDLGALTAAHSEAAGQGRLAIVEGEAGIGKTRVVAEAIATITERGAVVLAARCHDDEAGLPYGAVVELLRHALEHPGWEAEVAPARLADASLLLPELAGRRSDLPSPLALEGPGARARLLEGVAAVLGAASAGPTAGAVFVDDVHWADEATIDVLAYLGRRLRGQGVLMMLTWRSESVPPGHRLRRLAADAAREGGTTIVRLDRLDEAEVTRLVRSAFPQAKDRDLEQRVYLESEGLPLFVAEYLAALQSGEPAQAGLSGQVRSLLGARLGGLGSVARQVLGAAAVIGRSFNLDIVREASGRADEETVDALEELTGAGIVHETAGFEEAYDFSHQKLRELVYEETSLARRRLLHRRVAGALERRSADGEGAALVAAHLRLAGDDAEAARQYRLAAEHAVSLVAHADALEHLEAALALDDSAAADLHERLGDLKTLLGDYAGALASYGSAAALCEPAALASVEHKLGEVHERRGEWGRAEARFTAALAASEGQAGALRAQITADLSLTLLRAGQHARAAALAREACSLGDEAQDAGARAQAHNALGVLHRAAGDLEAAARELESSLESSERLGDPQARVAALNNLALVRRDAGELEPALSLTRRALELCELSGDRHREAALHNNLADLHHAAGRTEASMTHLKRAVAIFSEVGGDEATRLPEIWKLTSW